MDNSRRASDAVASVLAPAVDAARRVLVQREPSDIPHALRRVAQASGPRLAPPLWRKLLDHLDEDEQLRRDARELVGDGDAAAVAFLERSDGWWRVVAAAVEEVAGDRAGDDVDELRKGVEAAQEELAITKGRLADLRAQREQLEGELRAARADTSERIEAHRRADAEKIAELERKLRTVEERDASHTEEITRLEAELTVLRRRSGKVRSTPVVDDRSDRLPSVGGDPLAIARSLDLGFRMLSRRSGTEASSPDDGHGPSELTPPDGLRPTDPAWFDWLTSVDVPVWLIVDGHNVVFSISGDRSLAGDSMRRLETALRRLRSRSSAPLRVSLIYDSKLGGDRSAPQALGGLDLRFAPQHTIADDEIVELVGSASTPVVVVTSDRELQARVSARADLVIDGIALARFAGTS